MQSILRSLSIAALFLVALGTAQAAPEHHGRSAKEGLTVPVAGSFAPSNVGGPLSSYGRGSMKGTFSIQRFEKRQGQVYAVGTLVASLTPVDGKLLTNIVQSGVAIPLAQPAVNDVTIQQLACEILHLELGPLDLDLLGLVIHLDQIVLDITAVPGAGNLLGNLLCAIVNLLNSGGPLTQLVALLNQLLALLML